MSVLGWIVSLFAFGLVAGALANRFVPAGKAPDLTLPAAAGVALLCALPFLGPGGESNGYLPFVIALFAGVVICAAAVGWSAVDAARRARGPK